MSDRRVAVYSQLDPRKKRVEFRLPPSRTESSRQSPQDMLGFSNSISLASSALKRKSIKNFYIPRAILNTKLPSLGEEKFSETLKNRVYPSLFQSQDSNLQNSISFNSNDFLGSKFNETAPQKVYLGDMVSVKTQIQNISEESIQGLSPLKKPQPVIRKIEIICADNKRKKKKEKQVDELKKFTDQLLLLRQRNRLNPSHSLKQIQQVSSQKPHHQQTFKWADIRKVANNFIKRKELYSMKQREDSAPMLSRNGSKLATARSNPVINKSKAQTERKQPKEQKYRIPLRIQSLKLPSPPGSPPPLFRSFRSPAPPSKPGKIFVQEQKKKIEPEKVTEVLQESITMKDKTDELLNGVDASHSKRQETIETFRKNISVPQFEVSVKTNFSPCRTAQNFQRSESLFRNTLRVRKCSTSSRDGRVVIMQRVNTPGNEEEQPNPNDVTNYASSLILSLKKVSKKKSLRNAKLSNGRAYTALRKEHPKPLDRWRSKTPKNALFPSMLLKKIELISRAGA